MTIKTSSLILLPSLLLLSACAHQPACPCTLPTPPAGVMQATGPDMLQEMQSTLMPSLTLQQPGKNTGAK